MTCDEFQAIHAIDHVPSNSELLYGAIHIGDCKNCRSFCANKKMPTQFIMSDGKISERIIQMMADPELKDVLSDYIANRVSKKLRGEQ